MDNQTSEIEKVPAQVLQHSMLDALLEVDKTLAIPWRLYMWEAICNAHVHWSDIIESTLQRHSGAVQLQLPVEIIWSYSQPHDVFDSPPFLHCTQLEVRNALHVCQLLIVVIASTAALREGGCHSQAISDVAVLLRVHKAPYQPEGGAWRNDARWVRSLLTKTPPQNLDSFLRHYRKLTHQALVWKIRLYVSDLRRTPIVHTLLRWTICLSRCKSWEKGKIW